MDQPPAAERIYGAPEPEPGLGAGSGPKPSSVSLNSERHYGAPFPGTEPEPGLGSEHVAEPSCVSFNRDWSAGGSIDFNREQPSAVKRWKLGNQDTHKPGSSSVKNNFTAKHVDKSMDNCLHVDQRTENKLSNLTHLTKEREDALMAQIKSMDNKLSNMVNWMKEREDALMAQMKLMENKLNNMADRMREHEDAKMLHFTLKRLEEEGSESTESEHEPREEPSSHSDSDAKSSCVSFNSDRSMNRHIDFKGSGPSALKRKRDLEEEGSDSTEPEPREEPSSPSDSDAKSSCESFNSDWSMYRFRL